MQEKCKIQVENRTGKKQACRRRRYLLLMMTIPFLIGIVWGTYEVYEEGGIAQVGFWGKENSIRKELEELAEKNEEAQSFVTDFENRQLYLKQEIDLSGDYETSEVPLLMQWDKRWGYEDYGESMIGLAGCGPTCLAMVYIYFTGDITQNPRTMAEFADKNGYHTSAGTDWSLWTSGVEKLGLSGEMLVLDEGVMKRALDNGGVIVCSMRPGDFTTTGHFILLTGYDENGFLVNDPNRRSNSEKHWTYDTLDGQIKNLWEIRK